MGKPIIATAVEAMVDSKSGINKRVHGSRENRFVLMTSNHQASKTQYAGGFHQNNDLQATSEKYVKPSTVGGA